MTKRTQPVPPDSPRGRFDRIYRAGVINDAERALVVLLDVVDLRANLAEQEDYAVLRARQLGATWEQIGTALGTSKQAVHQRWGAVGDFVAR
jgi:hypothetical protein